MTYDHWKTTNPADADLGSTGAARHADDRTIVTRYIRPPIPTRSHDWEAHYDELEETGPYGFGPTEADAIADLLDNTEDDE